MDVGTFFIDIKKQVKKENAEAQFALGCLYYLYYIYTDKNKDDDYKHKAHEIFKKLASQDNEKAYHNKNYITATPYMYQINVCGFQGLPHFCLNTDGISINDLESEESLKKFNEIFMNEEK